MIQFWKKNTNMSDEMMPVELAWLNHLHIDSCYTVIVLFYFHILGILLVIFHIYIMEFSMNISLIMKIKK